ncbi:hypothetical protein ACFQV2_19890 [Actinokineospora soli]|uniref:Uncharacterized protein n=1 Tax=Actinokineospora soli TaxID=1048753 RepID=A0ABW2TPX8_9PSEU
MTAHERHRAARVVASAAVDAAEAARLLAMLGLDAADGIGPVVEPDEPVPPPRLPAAAVAEGRRVALAAVDAIRRAGP